MRRMLAVLSLVAASATLAAQRPGWRVPFQADGDTVVMGDGLLLGSRSDGALVAFGLSTGEERWRFQVGTPAATNNILVADTLDIGNIYSTVQELVERRVVLERPVSHSPLVYVASRHAQPQDLPNFYALDGTSGARRWSFFTPGGASGAVVPAGDRVIVVGKKFVHALDVATGTERWSFEPLAGLPDDDRRTASTPVIDDGRAYVTAWPNGRGNTPPHSYLFAVDAVTGNRSWTVDVSGNFVSTPVLDRSSAYFAVMDVTGKPLTTRFGTSTFYIGTTAHIYAVNRATGSIMWDTTLEKTEEVRTLLVRDKTLYAGAENGVFALDTATGAVRWRATGGYPMELTPESEEVYVMRPKAFAVLDAATGRDLRSFGLNERSGLRVWSGGLAYITWRDRISAFDIATGKKRWERRLDSVVGSVIIRDGALFVATVGQNLIGEAPKTGYIYRLDPATGAGG